MDQAEKLRNIVKQERTVPMNARVITVTSGKGGVGKSNLAINLAISFSRLGKKVIVLDADFGLANIEVMLGIRPIYNLADLMFRGKTLVDIVTEGPEGIGFISGGSGIKELTDLTKDQLIHLSKRLEELDKRADIIIIDTGAGIADNVMEFVTLSAEVLLVVTPEPTSITDAYALLKTLDRRPEFAREHCNIKLVANRASSEKEGNELFEKLSVVADKFLNLSLEYIGAIPVDANINKAVMKQQAVSIAYPLSSSSKAIEGVAEKILFDREDKLNLTPKRGLSGLFIEAFRRIQRKKNERMKG